MIQPLPGVSGEKTAGVATLVLIVHLSRAIYVPLLGALWEVTGSVMMRMINGILRVCGI